MSSQNNNNNNYATAPTSLNSYITRKLNNMDEAKMMKAKRDNWTKNYHKTLKGLEAMINIQGQVRNMMKIAAEANMIITEMEDSILKASINNWLINATNITEVSKDLWHLIQSDMENQVFQIQQMLADELDAYKGRDNKYVDENIQEIQEIYKENEDKKEGKVEDKEIILIKLYEIDESTSMTKSSFINNEVENLIKYMKFIRSPIQTRIFWPLLHYQSLKFRGEQNPEFWKEVAIALVKEKHNTEISQNNYPIAIYQGGLPHKLYFITIDNQWQAIIGPNKKTVVMYVVGELKVLIWFHGDMNPENRVLLWLIPQGCNME